MRKVSILTLVLGRKSNLFAYLMASYKFSSHSHVDTAFGVTLAGAAAFSCPYKVLACTSSPVQRGTIFSAGFILPRYVF